MPLYLQGLQQHIEASHDSFDFGYPKTEPGAVPTVAVRCPAELFDQQGQLQTPETDDMDTADGKVRLCRLAKLLLLQAAVGAMLLQSAVGCHFGLVLRLRFCYVSFPAGPVVGLMDKSQNGCAVLGWSSTSAVKRSSRRVQLFFPLIAVLVTLFRVFKFA